MPDLGEAWYELPEGDLQQGDLFFNVRFYTVEESPNEIPRVQARITNAAILTQTCDIPKRSQSTLLLAEFDDYGDLLRGGATHFAKSEIKKALLEGASVAEFLLPPSVGGELNWSLINFRSLQVVSKQVLQARGSQLRLRSPYKEHLAQAYARFMMRVGLPATLHDFKDYKPKPPDQAA